MMADIDWNESLKKIEQHVIESSQRKARDKAAFDVKLRNMKNDSDVLKEIAKLLFSIDQKMKG